MTKYILTEEQIKKVLSSGGIKKGIGLKINEGDSFYYKSVVKKFDNEDDFEDWKENLPEDQKVIGVINIEEEAMTESRSPEVLKRLRRLQELRDIIDYQTEIQDPCNFDDGEEYVDFCIREGLCFFYKDEDCFDDDYEEEDDSDDDYSEREEVEGLMYKEYYDKLVSMWESVDC